MRLRQSNLESREEGSRDESNNILIRRVVIDKFIAIKLSVIDIDHLIDIR